VGREPTCRKAQTSCPERGLCPDRRAWASPEYALGAAGRSEDRGGQREQSGPAGGRLVPAQQLGRAARSAHRAGQRGTARDSAAALLARLLAAPVPGGVAGQPHPERPQAEPKGRRSPQARSLQLTAGHTSRNRKAASARRSRPVRVGGSGA
jgi:hypothetical protein